MLPDPDDRDRLSAHAGPPGDAERRTGLADERTYLAWTRMSVGLFGLAIIIAGVVPALRHTHTRWPYETLGGICALLGLVCALYGLHRRRSVAAALGPARDLPPSRWFAVVLAGALVLVGLLILTLVALG